MPRTSQPGYLVEMDSPEGPTGWTRMAFRMFLVGAKYELRIRQRDNPTRRFRIIDSETKQLIG